MSLILKLFLLSGTGKKMYPQFLESLFKSRVKSFEEEKEALELEIQIHKVLLYGASAGSKLAIPSGQDGVVYDESKQSMEFVGENNDDVGAALLGSGAIAPTEDDLGKAAALVVELRNKLHQIIGRAALPLTQSVLEGVENEVKELQDPRSPNVNTLRLAKINKIAQLVSRRQRTMDILEKVQQQSDRYSSLIGGNEKIRLNHPFGQDEIDTLLEPFGNLIEDDMHDFEGPGSAARFIITDDQIISYDFRESDNNVFCRVDVQGEIDLLGEGPGLIGGVPALWAGGTDFDLWRQYGYRSHPQGIVNKPFFKDAELQCAPYAVMLLTRARRDAVQATLTVYGNEYYQLGDVVYVNSRDMLYYVTSVSHSFAYDSGTFTTTLELRYGHPLGEYIPTPLDVIGKNLIKNYRNFNTQFTMRKTSSSANGVHLGTVVFSHNAPENEDSEKAMLSGTYGAWNLMTLKNALLRASPHLNNGDYPKVEIRGYVTSSDTDEAKEALKIRMEAVKDWLMKPVSGYEEDEAIELHEDLDAIPSSSIVPFRFDEEDDPVDVQELTENNLAACRVPKEETWNVLDPGPNKVISNVVEILLVFR
jgi:hypothetical protein